MPLQRVKRQSAWRVVALFCLRRKRCHAVSFVDDYMYVLLFISMTTNPEQTYLAQAIALAAKAFENSYTKDGKPYITHCLRVMDRVADYGEAHQVVAVLHDLIEDTPYTLSQLSELGFTDEMVAAIRLMTHDPKVPYTDYVYALSSNTLARHCKMADLEDNSDIRRMKGTRKKDLDRMRKYQIAYMYLRAVEESEQRGGFVNYGVLDGLIDKV